MLLNEFDYIIAIIILFSSVISCIRGFTRESLSLVVWMFALWLGWAYTPYCKPFLAPYIHNPNIQYGVGFGILFLLALLLGMMLNHLLSHCIHKIGFSTTDRILGMLFGAAKAILFISIFLLLASAFTNMPKESWWHKSLLRPYFLPIEKQLYVYFSGFFKMHFTMRS